MANETQNDPRSGFVPRYLPWILGAAMLALYWFTLNRWITLLNLLPVSQVSGFSWYPQLNNPLTYLATLPIRWLPAASVPLAMNFFAAGCAALVLVLLARCVTLLPQDRTEAQRTREKSDFAFLTGRQAFFPPILAVLMLGLQLGFWEQATNFTDEMLGLLVFAFIVWQLLEYRLDEKEGRLTVIMLAYGAGVTEDWAFVGFFPVLLATIIWMKRLEFFNIRFLVRIVLSGLAGLLLLFLLPIIAKVTCDFKVGIWEAMSPGIKTNWLVIKAIKVGDVRIHLLQAALATLLPVLLMAIRWSANFGDASRIGTALATNMIHLVHAAVFGVCVWVMFNPPFSPDQLLGSPCLPLYFLCALSIGYCLGYFLLLFTRKPIPSRRNPKPASILPKPLMWLAPVITSVVAACALLALGTLWIKNLPIIRSVNDDTLSKFAGFTLQNLPPKGAILLCDSDTPGQNQPMRSLLIQAALARAGRSQDYPVLDTQSLNWAPYHHYLQQRYPHKIPLALKSDETVGVRPVTILELLMSLSKSNQLCYLHPSYGYYFEQFYTEPHGLDYELNAYPKDTLLPPPLTKELIAENETFWNQAMETLEPRIQKALAPPAPVGGLAGWLLMHLHPTPEPNQNALTVGLFCSRSLDEWGVQLQRAGKLEEAATRFEQATNINPNNVVAENNFVFNQTLRAGQPVEIDPARVSPDQFGKYRDWNSVVTANGQYDDPSFCFAIGNQYLGNQYFHQAGIQLERVRQLVPDNLDVRLQLAQIYLLGRIGQPALDVLEDPLTHPARFGLNQTNSTGLNVLAASAYFQMNDVDAGSRLLEKEIKQHPNDDNLLTAAAQVYMMRGLFTNALRIINLKLARSPDDATWLSGKGYASIQLGHYDDSIQAMTRVLALQTNNDTARFDRALAYLQSGQLEKARQDYRQLQTTYTNNYQIAYGLGEVAWRQHETNEAVRNFKLYVDNAPTNAPEFKSVRERLDQLRGQ